MHLREEKRIIKWVLVTSLVLMALMMAGISPDVMRHEGQRWVNIAAQAARVFGPPNRLPESASTGPAMLVSTLGAGDRSMPP